MVKAPPPNKPTVAQFVWNPFKQFLGESFKLNPDSSYDLDGTIVSYSWSIKSKEGIVTTSTTRYPTVNAASDSTTQRVNVDITKLTPLVTHIPKWKEYWIGEGEDPDTTKFLAGEPFVIRLKTTPANRVEGSVEFGGQVGHVDIPSSSFKLVSTSAYEYVWETTL